MYEGHRVKVTVRGAKDRKFLFPQYKLRSPITLSETLDIKPIGLLTLFYTVCCLLYATHGINSALCCYTK